MKRREECVTCRFYGKTLELTNEAKNKHNDSGYSEGDFQHRTVCKRFPEWVDAGPLRWCGEYALKDDMEYLTGLLQEIVNCFGDSPQTCIQEAREWIESDG